MKLDKFIGVSIYIFGVVISLLIFFFISAFSYQLGNEQGYKTGYAAHKDLKSYKGFNVDDMNVQVLIDEQSKCRYAVFNNKSVVPIYNGLGQVEGCGE